MLREEVFAVEIVVASPSCVVLPIPSSARVRNTKPGITAVEAQLEVLGGNVAFPFVLRREDGGAAVVGECAGELLGGLTQKFLVVGFPGSNFRGGRGASAVGVRGFGDAVVGGEGGRGGGLGCGLQGAGAARRAAACAGSEGVLACL